MRESHIAAFFVTKFQAYGCGVALDSNMLALISPGRRFIAADDGLPMTMREYYFSLSIIECLIYDYGL